MVTVEGDRLSQKPGVRIVGRVGSRDRDTAEIPRGAVFAPSGNVALRDHGDERGGRRGRADREKALSSPTNLLIGNGTVDLTETVGPTVVSNAR